MVMLRTKDYNSANLDRTTSAPIDSPYALVHRLRILAAVVLGCAVLAAGWGPAAVRPSTEIVQAEAVPPTLVTIPPLRDDSTQGQFAAAAP